MPRLILFGTCQKAIMDRVDNTISMITLMNHLTVQIPTGEIVPADAIIPVSWASVASWFRKTEDGERVFQQQAQLFFPDGNPAAPPMISDPFIMVSANSCTYHIAQGFPIAQEGIYTVTLNLREVGVSDWQEVASCPIEVIYQRQEGVQSEQ